MPSATVQSPGGCECEEPPCEGAACFALTGSCHTADRAGVTIEAVIAGTTTIVGSAVTDSAGLACISLPPGTYDFLTSKTGCGRIGWGAVAIDCTTVPLTGDIRCTPYTAWTVTVLGCYSSPLPGAIVTITNRTTGGSNNAETDSSGHATVYAADLGVYDVTIGHSSGRFTPYAGTFTQSSSCAGGSLGTITLAPATGYQCCAIQQSITPASPYPIKTSLKITDPGGDIAFNACSTSTACGNRTMSNVAAGDCSPDSYDCPDSGGFGDVPPTIGSGSSRVTYGINLLAVPTASQSTPTSGIPSYAPPPGPCAVPFGSKLTRLWRCAFACGGGTGVSLSWTASAYTINSLYPLNVTFTFPAGGVWAGSAGTSTPGEPYTTSIVVSEV